jgi:phospholipid/cholesterol/gamma-HCH transport system permease protein
MPTLMWNRLTTALRAVGSPVVDATDYAVRLAALIGEALLSLVTSGFQLRPVVRQVLYRQIYFTGVLAIPFAMLLALLVALVVAVQAPYTSAAGGGVLGSVLVVVVVRELGPVAAATIVIARSGSAMAAELATMRVDGEVETLAGLGVDPFEYLVVPRLLGTAVALFGLTVLFLAGALGASALLSPLLGGPSPRELLELVARALRGADATMLLAKTILPGLAIAAIACTEGLARWRATTEIPPAVTAAVVRSISVVFLWNTAVSALLYLA